MKFAIVNGNRTEAAKSIKGICPSCGSELIAKCGEFKINHWAHKGTRTCDPWWEPETEWHRSWKNNYPNEWQEVSLTDENTGEKHIADIRTAHNLVIEFQHSHIDPEERATREKFYRDMVWIVDGTRLKRDYPRFLKGKKDFRKTDKQGVYLVDFPDEIFPANWIQSSVPVIFDFKGLETIDDINDARHYLYCLFNKRVGRYAILAEIPRKAFINNSIDGNWLLRVQNFNDLIRLKQEQQKYIVLQQEQQSRLSKVKYRQRRGPLIDYIDKKQFSNQFKPKRNGRR
ncbi:MAG: competence protein CoiA family protein [Bacteroidota bacterium]|nr:competence protein CoiA family protein [Bacteroidota bacterium]